MAKPSAVFVSACSIACYVPSHCNARAGEQSASQTADRWQQVYSVAKASRSFQQFAAHLNRAQIPAGLVSAVQADGLEKAAGVDASEPQEVSPVAGADSEQNALEAQAVKAASEGAGRADQIRAESADAGMPQDGMSHGDVANASAAVASSPLQHAEGSSTAALHPELTRDWARKHARENVVIVTWSNWHFVDFVENWAKHLSKHRTPPGFLAPSLAFPAVLDWHADNLLLVADNVVCMPCVPATTQAAVGPNERKAVRNAIRRSPSVARQPRGMN